MSKSLGEYLSTTNNAPIAPVPVGGTPDGLGVYTPPGKPYPGAATAGYEQWPEMGIEPVGAGVLGITPADPRKVTAVKLAATVSPPVGAAMGLGQTGGSRFANAALAVLSVAGGAAGAYHGYKRTDSAGWAVGWFVFGSFLPVLALPIALAQGFAEPK